MNSPQRTPGAAVVDQPVRARRVASDRIPERSPEAVYAAARPARDQQDPARGALL